MSNAYKNVIVAGATGRLGAAFVNALLESPLKFNVHILARDTLDEKKRAQIEAWSKVGVKVISGDVTIPASLTEAVKGIDMVISCLSRDGLATGGELNLIQAAKGAGVKRFIPSQFGNDMHDFVLGQFPMIDFKVRAVAALKESGLEYVLVSCNTWLEFGIGSGFLGFDVVHADSVLIPNDGNSIFSASSLLDVPRLAIPALVDPATNKTHVVVAANNLTWNQIVDIAEQVRGVKLNREYVDTAKMLAKSQAAENPLVKLGSFVMSQYCRDIPRADFSNGAYNAVHADKYQGMHFASVGQFIRASLGK